MTEPAIFGVEGRRTAAYMLEYQVGPGRAVILNRERYRIQGYTYVGTWQVDGAEGPVTLCRVTGDSEAEVSAALELWLRLWLTSWGKAVGVEWGVGS